MTATVPPPAPPVIERRSHRMRFPLAVGGVTLGGLAYVAAVDPNQPGHYPLCPFRALTGLDCPGCGATRGLHALMHGDVVGALDHNVLLLVAIPAALIAWFGWVRRAWHGRADPGDRFALPLPAVVAIVVVIALFWVVRNLPGVPFLGSA